jgi:hypothetical protein
MQRGVLGTKGHLAGNGGLRGHSGGRLLPVYRVRSRHI